MCESKRTLVRKWIYYFISTSVLDAKKQFVLLYLYFKEPYWRSGPQKARKIKCIRHNSQLSNFTNQVRLRLIQIRSII